jgi:eukaryotic-like serine/threonine-protein kinase
VTRLDDQRRWEEIQASFDVLVELNAADRATRLAALATTDVELQRAVEALLAADGSNSAELASLDTTFLVDAHAPADPLGLAGRTISHFEVHEPLGAGGMGVVYRAEDMNLGRAVALKFLLPQYNFDDVAKARFVREAHSAAALDHPNLCAIHEVGTSDDGWLFLAMPLYSGETLRARIAREGSMSTSDALGVARQVAEGLQAAHAAGIVHRDLKPGNIMLLPDDTVRILDFGLAKARDQSLTESGVLLGTVSCMAPEQIRGGRVDARADLWALGVVLYEMLAGCTPFDSQQEIAIAHAILHDEPAFLSTHRPDVSAAVEDIVHTLLQKDPARRYATAADVLRELAHAETLAVDARHAVRRRLRRARRMLSRRPGRIAAVGTALLLLGVVTYVALRRAPAIADAPGAPASLAQSVAVLPFTNLGGDSTKQPFSDGIADELTTALGKVDGLLVAARSSAFSLERKGLEPREIGRQLHVRYVVEGRVSMSKERRRVGVDLIDVSSGKEVWSQDFEHALNRDEFTVQDSMTRSIVRQLQPHLSSSVMASVTKHATESPEAHDLYVQGRYFFEKKDSASFAKAQEYFRLAIQRDSNYAIVYTGLADAYSQQATYGFAPLASNMNEAKKYASRALAFDSAMAPVHVSRGFIALFYDWDWAQARQEFETALRLDDRYAPAHLFRAWYYVAMDSTNAAIAEGRRAVDLEPFSPLNNTRLVGFLFYGGRYTEALEQGRHAFERDSNFSTLRQELARDYVELGRCAEALAVLESSHDLHVPALGGVRGYTYAKCGRRAEALAEIERLRAQARAGRHVSHYVLAVIHAGLGETEQAIGDLERAYDEHVWSMYVMRAEPAFAALRSDPRFIALEKKVGLLRT